MREEPTERLRLAVTRIARSLDRQSPPDGHTTSHHMVMATLAKRDRMGIGELAEHEGVNPTMMSRIVARLESDGLVRRRPDADDGRAVQVEITDAGRAVRAQRCEQRNLVFERQLAALPEETVAQLLACLPALEALAARQQGHVADHAPRPGR